MCLGSRDFISDEVWSTFGIEFETGLGDFGID